MLVQEFIDRTGYQPSDQEWESINQTYTDCALDKDDFCVMWLSQNKEEVAYQKKAKWVHKVSYRLASLSGKPERYNKSQLIEFFKEYFEPKHLRNISELWNALDDNRASGYIQIVNSEVSYAYEYMHAATLWYDRGQQSPIFKISRTENPDRFEFELVRNIRMFDYWTVDARYPIQH